MAPTWMTAVNAVTDGSSTSRPSRPSAMVRWPVLDTGRNSVSPSTTPRTTASTIPMLTLLPCASGLPGDHRGQP